MNSMRPRKRRKAVRNERPGGREGWRPFGPRVLRGLKFDAPSARGLWWAPFKRKGRHYDKTFTTGIRPWKTGKPPLQVGEKRPPLVAGATIFAPKGETTHYDLRVASLLQIMFAVHPGGKRVTGFSVAQGLPTNPVPLPPLFEGALWVLSIVPHDTTGKRKAVYSPPPCIGGVPRSGIGDGERSEPISRMLFITYEAKEKHRAAFPTNRYSLVS